MQSYNLTVAVAFLGFLPLVTLLFTTLSPRRAVIASFLAGWLFLPEAEYQVSGMPDISKVSVISIGVFLAVALRDSRRLRAFRARWYDAPVLLLVLSSIPSSLLNGLGFYDGISGALTAFFLWGIPYLIGRLYLSTAEGLRDLAIGIVLAGLVYVPLCLYEVRMAPVLHQEIYGFMARPFRENVRWGGYRPVVFMRHGLQVALWMSTATVAAFGLWHLGRIRQLFGLPMVLPIAALLGTTVLCKTVGAWALLLLGVALLAAMRAMRSYLPATFLAVLTLAYILVRGSGLWDGYAIVPVAEAIAGPERAASLKTRLVNENGLSRRARQQLLFGWGGWGRQRLYNEWGEDRSTTDGRWIVLFGSKGAVGLGAFLLLTSLPVLLLGRRVTVRGRLARDAAPAVVLAMVLALWNVHNLPNASRNPIFIVIAGALMAWRPSAQSKSRRPPAERPGRPPAPRHLAATRFLGEESGGGRNG